MTEQLTDRAGQRKGRTRMSVALIATLVVFCVTALAVWTMTTLGLVFALATASPLAVILACSILTVDAVADCFAAIVVDRLGSY